MTDQIRTIEDVLRLCIEAGYSLGRKSAQLGIPDAQARADVLTHPTGDQALARGADLIRRGVVR